MIIGLTGKNASGKGEVGEFLESRGFAFYSLSDVIRDECRRKKLPVSRQNLTKTGNQLRHNIGPSVLAEKILENIEDGRNYVIDSIRNPEEIRALRRAKDFVLLCIESHPKKRFERIRKRNRENDPKTYAAFIQQEKREATNTDPTKQNLEACARLADFHLPNNGSLKSFHDAITKRCVKLLMNAPRPSWDEYFMRIAKVVASRSNCMKRHVAAIIVKDRRIVSTGYNGTPRGITNCNEGGCERCNTFSPSGQGLSECTCSHAEENAIVQSAYHGISIKDTTLYVTFSPCLNCTKMIINAGIKEVVFNENYPMAGNASQLLKEARIRVRKISPRGN